MELAHLEMAQLRQEMDPEGVPVGFEGSGLEACGKKVNPPLGVAADRDVGVHSGAGRLAGLAELLLEDGLGPPPGRAGDPPADAGAVAVIHHPLTPAFSDTGHRVVLG